MEDGEIKIKTKIDTTGIDKGTREIDGKLKESASSIEKLSKGTAGAVAAVAVKATKEILKGVREVTEAYKVQNKAEKALETAAKNNIHLNAERVAGLKKFASELQNVSNYGDEFTLQFMTRLAAAGRTQDEIQRIIKASADIAASSAMSFESAVNNLNKTFSGLAGELGESVPAIRNLTQEELKQGKAIDVLAAQYKGMAENVADVRIQMQNAGGDLKEAIGELTAPAANAWDEFWLNFYNKGIEVIGGINDKIDAMTFKRDIVPEVEEVALSGQRETLTDEALYGTIAYYESILEKSKGLTEEQKAQMRLRLSEKELADYLLTSEQELVYKMLKYEAEKREELKKKQEEQAKAAEQEAEAQKAINEQLAKQDEKNKKAAGLKAASSQSLEAQLGRMKKEAELRGESVDAQAVYNVILQNYLDLIYNSNGLISENNELSIERKKQLDEAGQALEKYNEKQKAADRLEEERGKLDKNVLIDDAVVKFTEEQEALKESRDYWHDLELVDEEERAEALKNIDEQILKNRAAFADEMVGVVQNMTTQTQDIVAGAAALATEQNKLQTENELNELEKKRKEGTVSEEEYEKKKTDIKRKSAKEQYKIDMANWAMSLTVAIANIAEGVTKAMSAGVPLGLINGALLAASGGVQLATIISNKPRPPAFERGGIVPGTSYTGDNVQARVNSGEMVLTRSQQKTLFNMANGQLQAAAGPQIVINNNAANMVSATASQIDSNKLSIMIDAHVNDALRSGKYTDSLGVAESGRTGTFYGI